MGSDDLPIGFLEGSATIHGPQDTRRSLLAKVGLVAGGVGLATLARPDAALAHLQSLGLYDVTATPGHGMPPAAPADPTGGNDSAPGINAAITEANQAGGGTVFLPSGTYKCDSAIKLKKNVTLLGLGRPVLKPGAPLRDPATNPDGRLVEMNSFTAGTNNYAQSDVTIQGVVLDGDGWQNLRNALVSLFSTDTLRIFDCEFRNYGGSTLHIGGCRNVTLRGLKFRNWGQDTNGAGLSLAGNNVAPDVTPTTHVRGYDLSFRDGKWTALQPLCRDFVFTNVLIESAGEGGVYTQGFNWDGKGENGQGRTADVAQDGVFSNFRIRDISAKQVSASGFEIGGSNIVVTDFVITDTDGPGLQMNWPAEDVTFENGQVYRTVRGSQQVPYLANYGQVHLIQRDDVGNGTTNYAMRNINVRNLSIGHPSVLQPTAKYAIRFDGAVGVGMTNVVIWPNDTRYGGSVVPVIFTPSTSVAPSANSANTEAGTPPRPYLTHKVFSETESVELFAQTWGNGKNAAIEARGKDGSGNEVRAELIARGAPDVSIGSTSNHEVVFIRNGNEVLRINNSNNVKIQDGRNIVLGTTSGTKIGTSPSERLGFFNTNPVTRPTVTGSRGNNAALASLLTALANLGLIVNNTTS